MKPDLALDIVACFVLIDDMLKQEQTRSYHHPVGKPGRPSALSDSELITIVLYGTAVFRVPTLKDLWELIYLYHKGDFPKLPSYQAFIDHLHRAMPMFVFILERLLINSEIRFMDSTKLPVCELNRAKKHKVAKKIASFGKNHQGWWYGFKLHLAIDPQGALAALKITPANVHDQNISPILTEGKTRIAVGDAGYLSSMMNRILWDQRGVLVLTPPHHTQKRKMMTAWQHVLLRARPKIEAVFDYLKEHLSLVSSFPRSIAGYLLHYLRVLLAYQFSLLVIS